VSRSCSGQAAAAVGRHRGGPSRTGLAGAAGLRSGTPQALSSRWYTSPLGVGRRGGPVGIWPVRATGSPCLACMWALQLRPAAGRCACSSGSSARGWDSASVPHQHLARRTDCAAPAHRDNARRQMRLNQSLATPPAAPAWLIAPAIAAPLAPGNLRGRRGEACRGGAW